MLQIAVTLLQWLPRIFLWLIVPAVAIAIVLTFTRRTRERAALAFIIAAAISASFLSLETAALAWVCADQARLIFSLLLDMRPGVTAGFITSMLGTLGAPLSGLLPMLVAGLCTGLSALALRGKRKATEPVVVTESGTA